MDEDLVARFEAAVSRLEALDAGALPLAVPRDLDNASARDPAILAFDDLVAGAVRRVTAAAGKIGAEVAEVTNVLEKAFLVGRDLLVRTKQTQKPPMESMAAFMVPLNETVLEANVLAEGTKSNLGNHLKATASSLAALAWIGYTGKDGGMSLPIAHVEESWQMAEFYNNKVLVEYKTKNPDHVEWAKALKELYVPSLRDYVKQFYPLGPVWKPSGSATNMEPSAPPCSPSASLLSFLASSSQPTSVMSAVCAEVNSEKAATQGDTKVIDDMKNKKNSDRTDVVSTEGKESHNVSTSSLKETPTKLELQMGRKWVVEHHVGNKSLTIDDCDTNQSVYVYGCKDCMLEIKGKANNITIDKCSKMGVSFKGVVAACEVVNCNGVEIHCEGLAPTISVDNTSGCQIYSSKESLETSVATAKSSQVNALVPDENSDGDCRQERCHTLKESDNIYKRFWTKLQKLTFHNKINIRGKDIR